MKETFYFSHDYNARFDEKIKLLIRKHGMCGYGCYWSIIEDLYQNANALRLDYEGIAYDLRIDIEIIKSVINDFELFIIDNNIFGSLSVERRINERNEKSKKAKISASCRWGKQQGDAFAVENNANALRIVCDGNAIKESKLNESKNIISVFSFDEFWNLYNKKTDTSKCRSKYTRLSEKDKGKIKDTLPEYLKSIKDRTFLKNPQTYLNNRCWNDEFIFNKPIVLEVDRICIYCNEARQQVNKEVQGTYSSYQKALEVYPGKVKFIKYV